MGVGRVLISEAVVAGTCTGSSTSATITTTTTPSPTPILTAHFQSSLPKERVDNSFPFVHNFISALNKEDEFDMRRTPLLLLLDGILSQDATRTEQALEQLKAVAPLPATGNPMTSGSALESILRALMRASPELAAGVSALDGSLPLHFAASIGNIRVAHILLQAHPKAAVTPNKKGKIPLHYAAREGRSEMVEFFMRETPQTAAIQSKKDKLALHFAAGEGHRAVVRALLLAHPEGASLPSKKGKVALHFAARWGHVHVAADLLRLAPQTVAVLDHDGSSPFHDAAREGQLEMMKFLAPKHPKGLIQENIRCETPLFPAVRSGNVDLVRYMLTVCPLGGRHVLQRVRDDDNVQDWDPELLELCLRGSVNNWTQELPSELDHAGASPSPTAASAPRRSESMGSFTSSTSELDINLPRSKSPHLDEVPRPKKRSAKDDANSTTKRPRSESFSDIGSLSELKDRSEHRSFYQLHAALESGASAAVLNHVLDIYGESQLEAMDELGRLPLHVALEASPNEQVTDVILERIWKPYPEACHERDFLGRLPLHHALLHRASPKIIQALLETNPSAGVEYCDVLDARYIDKLPIYMALQSGCDLSTVFMLLRGDPSVVSTF
eukprot:Nitzschia sp. Nitz4//scaffold208_size52459//17654//19495//NITZ4_006810-RA/size52459-processed-gene-0.24-mRNA-1//1//CDS//3329541651//8771//frame0